MSENAGVALDNLATEFPQHSQEVSSLDQVLSDGLGSVFHDSAFVDVFFDVEDDAVIVELNCITRPLMMTIPGLGSFSISVGRVDELDLEVAIVLSQAGVRLFLLDAPIHVQCIRSDLLIPVNNKDGRWEPDRDSDGGVKPISLVFSGVSLEVDSSPKFEVTTDLTVDLPPVRIGKSGVVVEMKGLRLCMSDQAALPAGIPAGSRGFAIDSIDVYLPESIQGSFVPGEISATGLFLGSGGFTGTLSAAWTAGKPVQLAGIECTLKSLMFEFKQNSLVGSELVCELMLPFFDRPVNLDVSFSGDGSLLASLSAVQPAGVDYAAGLITFDMKDVFRATIDGISFGVKNGVSTLSVSGSVQPTFPLKGTSSTTEWPIFRLQELSVNTRKEVFFKGGWMELPQQFSLDFHGFKLGITKLGFFRTDDEGMCISFTGGIQLVAGMTGGASVKGLQITWYDDGRKTRVSFEGVGVEFTIPEVLTFKGAVSMRELEVNKQKVRRFDGDIKLKLISLKLKIDAKLVFGSASGGPQGSYNFFAIYLGVELPTGIPLGSLPLSLYGMAGLFALQMEPNRKPEHEWYEDWYKLPQPGVTELSTKWWNQRGSMALGGGVTLGTNDNGFTFACKVLLVIVFPGPIIMIEGKANLLKERAKLSEDPMFRTLAVLDMREGQVVMGLDARYKQDSTSGKVLDIRAGAEAFFATPKNWHLYLGEREPRDKRIRAEIFKLFEANAYFMLDPQKLATGAWVGYARRWQYGPVGVSLEAWLEGNVVVNWSPLHFHGDLWLHGLAEVKAFGFGVGLSVDARFEADVFQPFHLLAQFEVSINLPRPLKGRHIGITLEWGPTPDWPAIPSPFKEVAMGHFKVTTTWPLAAHDTLAPPVPNSPVVPLDGRLQLSFTRPVHDKALVGINPYPVIPEFERIGDPAADQGPARVRYALTEVELLRWDAAAQQWRTVAVAGRPPAAGERTLYGSWAPVPGVGQTPLSNDKLWLWSITPFDFTRHGGSEGDDWFLANFPDYPCVPQDVPEREVCCDFERLGRMERLQSPWRSPEHPEVTVAWGAREPRRVTVLDPPVDGHRRALCLPLAATPAGDVPPVPAPRTEPGPPVRRDAAARGGAERAAREPVREPPVALVDPVGVPLRDGDDLASSTGGVIIRLSDPAKRVRVWFVPKKKAPRVCLDFRGRQRKSVRLPLEEQGVRIGPEAVTATIAPADTTLGDLTGLSLGGAPSRPGAPPAVMDLTLPCAAATVELIVSYPSSTAGAPRPMVTAFDAAGQQVAAREMRNPPRQPELIRFEGEEEVKRITISGAAGAVVLHQLCFACPETTSTLAAAGFDDEGRPGARVETGDGMIDVTGERLTEVRLSGAGEICLLRICAVLAPSAREVAARQEMAKHLKSEVARWQQAGEVLEPFTDYRLRIVTTADAHGGRELNWEQRLKTETTFADFCTQGPPGLTQLTVPAGQDAGKFESGLDDLTRYVRQTTPPTVPAPGEKPVMFKPFYCANDIGLTFDENYVDLMYRMSGRDLGLYLYDGNNEPVRDVHGRLVAQSGEWGAAEELTLTEGEERWVALSEGANGCLPKIDRSTIVRDRTLTSAVAGRVLAPDTVYEARLIPLLLRETFRGPALGDAAQGPAGRLGRWQARDAGDTDGPSRWEVRETAAPAARYLAQTSGIATGGAAPGDPAMRGTVLVYGPDPSLPLSHAEQPTGWTDVRLSAYVRTEAGGAIGLVFRYQDDDNHYRFSLACGGALRRLVRVAGGVHTVLAQDAFACEPGRDPLLTVEAVGTVLRAYHDGARVFDVADAAHATGTVGLYAYGNPDARFADVRLDDFRKTARPVSRFQFTTSNFVNFFHHLHSYQDETWRTAVESTDVAGALPALGKAVPPAALPGEDEARAYAILADAVLGPSARRNPPEVQVTRVEVDGAPLAFLVQSPEPMDWLRTEIALQRTPFVRTEPALPGKVKLAAVRFAPGGTQLDSVDVLLREPMDLAGYRVESRLAAWPLSPDSGVVVAAQDAGAAQGWVAYHAFAPAGMQEAGTVLRLPPGVPAGPAEAQPAAAPPAAVDAASVNPALHVLFSMEVRIVAPDGTVVHGRHFLPDGDYVPQMVNVLRKADGTGFFMLMPGAAAFPPEQYRLMLAYHRDNRARVPASPVWSQAGNTDAETVALDIPLQTQ